LDAAFYVQALRLSQAEIFNIDPREHSSLHRISSAAWTTGISESAWMAGVGFMTIFSLKDFGGPSNTRMSMLHDYRSVSEAHFRIASCFQFYNTEQHPEGLGYRTPYEVSSGQLFNPEHVQAISALHLKQAHYLS
jgi:hypothetical protein